MTEQTRLEIPAARLSTVLDQNPPPPIDGPTAAVAAVFRTGEAGTELLFIQRASKDSDPWSGQMAFPGGRRDPDDRDSHHTAERETLEELGVDLAPATRLGSFTRHDGGRHQRRHLLVVDAHGYWLPGEAPPLTPNYEVADALWVPLAVLADRSRYIDHWYEVTGSEWPGIQLDIPAQVVWGLTLRFLGDLFARLDLPFITLAPPPE